MKRTSLQDIASGSKRACNQSKDTKNGLTLTFLYLGVFKFLTMSTKLSARELLPDTVKVNDTFNTLIHDDQIKLKWENYLKEITGDNRLFFSFFNCDLRQNEAVAEHYFTLHHCEELTYYIYCYKQYQRCSDSKWQFWCEVFLTHKNLDTTDLDFSPCHEQHNCYLKLSPYFWDNSTLEQYLNNCTVEEGTEMKGMLLSAKSNKEQQGMFAYKEEFNEDGANWDENVWTKRLGACIGKYIVSSSYTVEYTGDKGRDIYIIMNFIITDSMEHLI